MAEVHKMQEQFSARSSLNIRRSCASMRPRHTVHPWT